MALAGCGRPDDAIAEYRKALEINPHYRDAYNNLGVVLGHQGHTDAAIAEYGKALEIAPDNAAVQNNLASALMALGRVDEAIIHLRKALAINPGATEFHCNLGQALAMRGRLDEAIVHFQTALQIKPDSPQARRNLDMARSQREGILKALAQRHELLRSRPEDVALLNDTAWMLATNPNASIRNGAEAVELAQRAINLTGGSEPAILGTLAAAYAEAGRFSEAVQTARKATELATQQNNPSLTESIKAKIPFYEAHTAFCDGQSAAGGSVRP
jgi:superkiller protein 3